MLRPLALFALYGLLSGCAAMDAVLDYPMSFFDEETGETVTAPLGDVIADSGDSVASTVGDVLGGVNPLLGLLGAGGAGALLAKARRRKKVAVQAEEAPATPKKPDASKK